MDKIGLVFTTSRVASYFHAMTQPISKLQLPPWLKFHVQKIGDLSCREVVEMSESQVTEKYGISRKSASIILFRASAELFVLDRPLPKISTWDGLPILWRGSISEICGAAGIGKTQLCKTIAAVGNWRRVIWFDTENSFSPERVNEIACSFKNRPQGFVDEVFLDRIKIKRVVSLDEILGSVRNLHGCIGADELVVVDSIAAAAMNISEIPARQKLLYDVAQALKALNTNILVVNHVRADIELSEQRGTSIVKPALGISWAHEVNAQVMLFMENEKRFIRTTKVPISFRDRLNIQRRFFIGKSGLKMMDNCSHIVG